MSKSRYLFSAILCFVFLVSSGFSGAGIRSRVVNTYTKEIGVREQSGRNDGARVETYLRYVNLPKGNPWCAAFVCWAYGQNNVTNPRSAWSPDLFPSKKVIYKRNVRSLSATPKAGDAFGLYFPSKGRVAHVGYIDDWPPDSIWCITVEGNTNEAGSREGDGVYKKRRLKSSIYIVADFIG